MEHLNALADTGSTNCRIVGHYKGKGCAVVAAADPNDGKAIAWATGGNRNAALKKATRKCLKHSDGDPLFNHLR